MQKTLSETGITFAVDDVIPATELLPECRAHEALRKTLESNIEGCSDYHGMVIENIHYQPLLAAVYTAFNQHRPLVLTPDAVWITIVQGIAHHMAIHGERLRSKFVAHRGKLDLIYRCYDWAEGAPENPWPDAFESWTDQIRNHVGQRVYDTIVCDFSSTGPVERAVSHIAMMDVFERYFHYNVKFVCGIPSITLDGKSGDWERLSEKVRQLEIFDIGWWLKHLGPICKQFVRASCGDVDLKHWQKICKLREAYGGHIVNGWVAKLFPYLRAHPGGPCNRRNPIFETGAGLQTSEAPPGLSRVPFLWRNMMTRRDRHMEVIGGLVGVVQNSESLALQPKAGWAVRGTRKLEVLLAMLADKHATVPALHPVEKCSPLPPDLCQFYHLTDGASLYGSGSAAAYRILPAAEIEPLDWGEVTKEDNFIPWGPNGRIWHRFAWLADGSWLAINLDQFRCDPSKPEEFQTHDRLFHAICHGTATSQGRIGENPVVAVSFTELLERMLQSRGQLYWHDPEFVGYGDAELFTRRESPFDRWKKWKK